MTFKEYALQDGNTLEATQTMIESRAVTEFPLNDQEILLRHLHKTARRYVDELRAERSQTPVSISGGVLSEERPRARLCPRVRRPRAVRRLVAPDRERALREASRELDGRAAGLLRRRLPPARRRLAYLDPFEFDALPRRRPSGSCGCATPW